MARARAAIALFALGGARALLAPPGAAARRCRPPRASLSGGVGDDTVTTDVSEWTVFYKFNSGLWKGTCASTLIDATARTSSRDALLDGRAYASCFRASSDGGVDEALSWEGGGDAVISLASPKTLSADFDGSFSAEYAKHGLGASRTFEASLAVGDDARVRVLAAYGADGRLVRVSTLAETRVGADEAAPSIVDFLGVVDVFGLEGEWRGDATVRRPGRGATNVVKQDLSLNTDGDRLYRELTVYDADGSPVQTLPSFGAVSPPSADAPGELVLFDGDVALCLRDGAYVLAPLRIGAGAPYFVEAGVYLEEPEGSGAGQLPISVRGGGDVEFSESRRFLSRSVRLYDGEGDLASVTTSYHQLYPAAA